MTTPHAPEGGPEPTRDEVWESLSPEDRAAIERGTKAYYERWAAGRFPSYEEAAADDEGQEILIDFYRDLIGRPIAMRREEKLRADVATAERARLAGLASEEDRAMVERVIHVAYNDGLCDAKQYARKFYQAERLGEALLARLAAARGEAVEEAALCTPSPAGEDVDAVESLNEANPDYGLTQRLIEAVEQGTRTDELIAQAAILIEFTRLRTALAAAERAGAEKYRHEIVSRIGSGDYPWPTNLSALDKALSAIHAALFPPPGAEVGRG